MSNDQIRKQVRQELLRLRLGTDQPVCCALCGECEPTVLRRASRRLIEFHHLAGEANDAELGVFLCLTHHGLCTEMMREGIPLAHARRRVLLERLQAALRGEAIYCRIKVPLLEAFADDLGAEIVALDKMYPGWRDLEQSQ